MVKNNKFFKYLVLNIIWSNNIKIDNKYYIVGCIVYIYRLK